MKGVFPLGTSPLLSCWNADMMARATAAILRLGGTRLTLRLMGREMERTWVLDDLTKLQNHPEVPYAQGPCTATTVLGI